MAELFWQDPRARRGLWHFFEHWLALAESKTLQKNWQLFLAWDEELRADMLQETRLLVEAVLWEEDARLTTLLQASFTYGPQSI